jgi:hypothetical protein
MRARWPLKQTMPIRWSAPMWRPKINFGALNEPERPDAVRIVRNGQARLNGFEAGAGI